MAIVIQRPTTKQIKQGLRGYTTESPAPIPKLQRWESKKYRKWVSEHPCIICGKSPPNDPHHLKIKGNGGMSRKPDDVWCVPLCREHHNEIETSGKLSFEATYNIDLIISTLTLCQEWIMKGN
jgi:hypothetical protein